jgi:hypothetical protein
VPENLQIMKNAIWNSSSFGSHGASR